MKDDFNTLLDQLYSKTGYFSNGNVKDQIKKAKDHLNSLSEEQSLNQTIVTDPFFTAFKEDPITFQEECLKFFVLVYSSGSNITPSIAASNLIAKIALDTNFKDPVEMKTLFCKFITTIMKSKYSNHFSHTIYLPKSVSKLYLLIKNTRAKDLKILISKTIFEIYQFLLERIKTETQTEEMHNTEIEKLTKEFVTDQTIIEPYFAPFEPSTTVAEIDYFLALLPPLSMFSEKNSDQILSQTMIEPFILLISSEAPILKKMIFYTAISSFYKPLMIYAMNCDLEQYPEIVGKLICKIYQIAKTESLQMISSILYDEIIPRFSSKTSMDIGTTLKHVVGCHSLIIDLARELPDHRTIQFAIRRLSSPFEGKLEPSKYGISVLYQLLKTISNFSFKLSDQFEFKYGNDKLSQILKTNSPKDVIKYLTETGKIKNSKNSSLINYLNKSGLSKDLIGIILFSVRNTLLKDFIGKIDVRCPLGVAYRRVFSQFHIPPKQRNVEYALLCFATHYFKSNPGCAKSSDSIYIVAFNTYLLHTDRYFWNPIINFDYFCILNAKGDDGSNFEKPFLLEIFEEIGKGKIYPMSIIPGIFTPSQMRFVYENIVPKDCDYYIASSIVSNNFDMIFNAFRSILISKSPMEHTKKYALNGLKILYGIIIKSFDHARATRMIEFASMTPPFVRQSIAIAAASSPAFVTCGYDLIVDALLDIPDDTYMDTFIGRTETMTMQQIFDLTDAICRLAHSKGAKALLVFPDLAYYNRGRPVFAWLGIWGRMHATLVSFARTDLAMAAVDICRQLCTRILESAPQRAFSFQQFYVLPLLEIFDRTDDIGVKETVVISLLGLVRSLAPVLNTAWDTVLQILASAAAETVATQTVFEILSEIARHPLPIRKHVPHLVGVITTLVTFFPDRMEEAHKLLWRISDMKNTAGGWTTCVQAASLFAERGASADLFVALAGKPLPTASRLFLLTEELPRLQKVLGESKGEEIGKKIEKAVMESPDAAEECIAFAVYLAKHERFDELDEWVFGKCDPSKHSSKLRESLKDLNAKDLLEKLPEMEIVEDEKKENENEEEEGKKEYEKGKEEVEEKEAKKEVEEEEEEVVTQKPSEILKEGMESGDYEKCSSAIAGAIQALEDEEEGAEEDMITLLGVLSSSGDIKGATKGSEKALLGLIRSGTPEVRKALAPLLTELM